MFFLFSSDIFVTLRYAALSPRCLARPTNTIHLRIYAITLGNKVLVAYFGLLALARLVMAFVTAFYNPSAPMPIQFRLVPNSVGTTFGMWLRTLRDVSLIMNPYIELSAFLVIVFYTYRNKRSLKFSGLVFTVVTESTVYFLAMVAAQIYVQISYNLIKVWSLSRPLLRFVIITHDHRDHNFRFCEYAVDTEDDRDADLFSLM